MQVNCLPQESKKNLLTS